MAHRTRRPIAIVHQPLYTFFLPVAVVCFLGAMITDIAYRNSGGTLLWVNFSSWLLAAGLVFAGIAIVVLLIDAIRGAASWITFLLLGATWLVELVNSFVHARDGWTAVVPLGLILSIIGAILVLVCAWLGRQGRHLVAGAGA